MAQKTFSIKEAIRYGWKTTISQPVIILYMLIAMFSTQVVESLFGLIFPDASESIYSVVQAVMTIFSIVLSIGMIRLVLNIYEKKQIKFENLYEDWKLIGWYLLAALFNVVAVIAGLVLLIIPGIYIAVRLCMWPYFMLEGEKNSFNALKKSWNLTDGLVLKFLGFFIIQILVLLAGIIAVLVGLLVAIPVINLSLVFVYKKLTESAPKIA
jgi:uncharacterized membrane protein